MGEDERRKGKRGEAQNKEGNDVILYRMKEGKCEGQQRCRKGEGKRERKDEGKKAFRMGRKKRERGE